MSTLLPFIEHSFDFLDQLPETLYETIVTHPHGNLQERSQGILQWQAALLAGQLPDPDSLLWPEKKMSHTLLERLETLNIIEYCSNEEALSEQILLDICNAVSSIERLREQNLEQLFEQMRKQPSQLRRKEQNQPSSEPKSPDSTTEEESPATPPATAPASQASITSDTANMPKTQPMWDEFQNDQDIQMDKDAAIVMQVSIQLEQQWQQWLKEWQALQSTLSELGSYLGNGWDLSQGVLAHYNWRDIIRYRRLIKKLPWIRELIRLLGRLHETSAPDKQHNFREQIISPLQCEQVTEVPVPQPVPMSTQGISRSDDIARMLPSEASYLGHPVLHGLWHAKRAEHSLLCYEVQGVLSEHQPERSSLNKPTEQTEPNAKTASRGPILVCLDSSASMQGEHEMLAKAITLEVLSVAHKEQRDCYLYSFSGSEQILHHQLALSNQGIGQLLEFLTRSFQGGTDVGQVFYQTLKKLQQKNWQQADILLVSDGRFVVPEQTLQAIKKAKQQQHLRIHGLLMGSWSGSMMKKICQPLHTLSDWQNTQS